MKMNRFGKTALCLAVLLSALLLCAFAAAEATVTFSPENPRVGDYVDVTVTPDKEGALGVMYTLKTSAGVVCEEKKETKHFTTSFRPREEAEYTLTATIVYGKAKKDRESVSVTIPVSGEAPAVEGEAVLYSQKDGWWHKKMYSVKHRRSLEKAGCAIFTLSHALQRLGFSGDEVLPDKLASRYTKMYIEGRGTDNERLLQTASQNFGFQTHSDLIESEAEVAAWLRRGGLYSFSIVIGHIALADSLSEDGTKVHIVDSAPGATYERIKKSLPYIQQDNGVFKEAAVPEDIPGCRWFFESGEYGGLEYWLDISYVAKRGVRPLRQAWMTLDGSPVTSIEYAGAMVTKVSVSGGESQRVNTRDLQWTTTGAESPQLALVTAAKGVSFTDGNGSKKEGFNKAIPYGTMLIVLEVTDKQFYVAYRDSFGYISRTKAELLPVSQDSFTSGIISINGRTSGNSPVTVRKEPSSKKGIGEWKVGTPVAVISAKGDYYFAEGKGLRGWVHKDYLTLEGAGNDGQKVDKGK